jgi:hypothetical protein
MMTDTNISQNLPVNPDPQGKGVIGNDITIPQGQQQLPERPPKGLADWLVRVHLRLIALEQEKHEDSPG